MLLIVFEHGCCRNVLDLSWLEKQIDFFVFGVQKSKENSIFHPGMDHIFRLFWINVRVQVVNFKVILLEKLPYRCFIFTRDIGFVLIGMILTNMQLQGNIMKFLSKNITLYRFIEGISALVVRVCPILRILFPDVTMVRMIIAVKYLLFGNVFFLQSSVDISAPLNVWCAKVADSWV